MVCYHYSLTDYQLCLKIDPKFFTFGGGKLAKCFELAKEYLTKYKTAPSEQDDVDMKLSVTYNSIASSSEISVDIFDATSYDFTLNEGESSISVEYTGDSITSANLYFTTSISSLNVDLFNNKIFL